MSDKLHDDNTEYPVNNFANIRENILNRLLIAIAIISIIPLISSLYRMKDLGWQIIMSSQIAGFLIVGSVAVFHKRIPYLFKSLILCLLAFLLGAMATLNMGIMGSGILFMFFSILFATMFLNVRAVSFFIIASFSMMVFMAFATSKGWIVFAYDVEATAVSFSSWISKATGFILFSTIIIVSLGSLIKYLVKSGETLRKSKQDLAELNIMVSKNEQKYREIFNASSDGILISDAITGVIVEANFSLASMYGYTNDEMIGLQPVDLSSGLKPYDDKGVKETFRKVKKEGSQIFEWQAKKSNGEFFWIEFTSKFSKIGNEERFISVARDITNRKKMNELLIQNEKMLSVGELAAGMAHEIKNPLAGMIQNANVLSNRLTQKTMPANKKAAKEANTTMEAIHYFMGVRDIPRMIKAITDSGKRMASIVENMLNFSRKSDATFSTYNPVELLDQALELAATDFDFKKQFDFKAIAIKKIYGNNLPLIVCEGSKIQQVLLNILKNGGQAMFENSIQPNPEFTLRLNHEVVSNMLKIEIEDNGPGMDNNTYIRIFEPFFTTKPIGVGTGLGLSVSYFIITENHKGTIEVESELGKGTNFIIRLPVERQ